MPLPNTNQPTNIELYLEQLVELNQQILRELLLQNLILVQNGVPLGDDLDKLRNDTALNDYQRSM